MSRVTSVVELKVCCIVFSSLFQNLAIMVVSVGFVFVLVYHIGVKEKAQCYDNRSESSINCEEEDEQEVKPPSRQKHIRVIDWLKEHQFYQVI